uniref:GPI alpha-1,4-mannosyltransferase I, catalytic subunit n=1 Tax=Parascaris equorum TaxID=6256 RepID=A0A914RQ08_PAREQ
MSFALSILVYFLLYGNRYIYESLLYHISRTDTRHNFSPYFYSFYLLDGETTFSQLVGRIAFGPQAALILLISVRFYDDLPFCWMLLTMAFIAFNKVCTSQYFLWFISLLPIAQRSIEMSLKRSVVLSSMWVIAQAIWLLAAYFLEFWGVNSFLFIWLASLLFFSTNVFIVAQLITHYRDPFQNLKRELPQMAEERLSFRNYYEEYRITCFCRQNEVVPIQQRGSTIDKKHTCGELSQN